MCHAACHHLPDCSHNQQNHKTGTNHVSMQPKRDSSVMNANKQQIKLLFYSTLLFRLRVVCAFVNQIAKVQFQHVGQSVSAKTFLHSKLYSQVFVVDSGDNDDDDDDYDDDEEDEDEDDRDPYLDAASSEFLDDPSERQSATSSIVPSDPGLSSPTTGVDWGGALGRLRERVEDFESGDSKNPSKALFRLMSSESPNQAIGSFISRANPQVIEAMSSAVSSLLGGLANPQSGVQMIVKASGEKIGSLCFQLQMTGYMFRNAEYVMALKKIMDISSSATLDDYKEAFDRLDRDGSGYIEASEVRQLLDQVYKGETPSFEINAFVKFFDKDDDGRVSWEEFKLGLGTAMAQQAQEKLKLRKMLSPSTDTLFQRKTEDEEDEFPDIETSVSGTLEVEMEDGTTVEVDAADYLQNLKEEARTLKEALRKEKLGNAGASGQLAELLSGAPDGPTEDDTFGGIASYIASRQGDIKSLTEGISPEIVDAMKMLVDFVLEGGASKKGSSMPKKEEMSMEIPASALQQLALWQLILGYQLREVEAKGDYIRLLE